MKKKPKEIPGLKPRSARLVTPTTSGYVADGISSITLTVEHGERDIWPLIFKLHDTVEKFFDQ